MLIWRSASRLPLAPICLARVALARSRFTVGIISATELATAMWTPSRSMGKKNSFHGCFTCTTTEPQSSSDLSRFE